MRKVIIAGCRDFTNYNFVENFLDFDEWVQSGAVQIVQGGAAGVDAHAKTYAIVNDINHKQFDADWKTHGKAAGPIRNEEMADYGDCLIAFWDGVSAGTRNMIATATKKGLPTKIVSVSVKLEKEK